MSGFVISRHQLALRGLHQPVRVVHMTDLHFGRLQRINQVERWVDAALQQNADLIVVTGDFVDHPISQTDLDALVRALSSLRAPLGVFAVPGNHDHGSFKIDINHLIAPLEAVGIRFLVNTNLMLRPDLVLAGVDDLWLGSPDLYRALEGVLDGPAVILMAHNPDQLVSVPSRVDLTLSGHTHGGQIVLPVLGALHTGSDYGQRFAQGFVRADGEKGARGFVSRGLGTTLLPVRLMCAAELVVLDLEPQ
jgi:uncharacterized protein